MGQTTRRQPRTEQRCPQSQRTTCRSAAGEVFGCGARPARGAVLHDRASHTRSRPRFARASFAPFLRQNEVKDIVAKGELPIIVAPATQVYSTVLEVGCNQRTRVSPLSFFSSPRPDARAILLSVFGGIVRGGRHAASRVAICENQGQACRCRRGDAPKHRHGAQGGQGRRGTALSLTRAILTVH